MEWLLIGIGAVVLIIVTVRVHSAWLDRSSQRAVDELERRHSRED